MEWKDINGDVFLYDVTKNTELEKLKNSHVDFQADLGDLNKQRKQFLRFIILQYDLNTPLRLEYNDYFKRKANAALLAGFKRNKQSGKFKESVADAMVGKNDAINGMIIRYLMNFYNEDYLQLILYWEYLGQLGRNMLSDLSPQKINVIDNMRKAIGSLTEKIFGGNESVELKQSLYRALDMEKNNLHPDNVTKDLQENSNLFKEA